ncbi:MAG: PIN/TRAM domain-containing protein [Planctomycetaceae bacterium]|nr:PIN/TRAM domain-containing protein [Planctomycetaceae bacterium]
MIGLLVLRVLFILVASGVGYSVMSSNVTPDEETVKTGIMTFFGTVGFAIAIIIGDMLIPRKRVDWISSIYFGVLVGLLLTTAIHYAVAPLWHDSSDKTGLANFTLILCVVLCYVCTSFLIQTRDDFRFIIPYVEFRKNLKGSRPLILDTSVVIDGRIADVMETMLIDSRLVMPRFAINELQRIADSADRGRRTRGRRGLDILNRLQKIKGIEMQIDDTDLPEFRGQPVDLKLVALTRHLEGKLVTNDYNLNKVAKIQGVDVINLNDLANAMKPVFLPGERLDVDIVKMGEEVNQGIGYLDDGTMVVVDNGKDHVSEKTVVTVTSVRQTSAGRMIFGKYEFTTKKLSGSAVNQDNVPSAAPLGQNKEPQSGAAGQPPAAGQQSSGKNGGSSTVKYKKT